MPTPIAATPTTAPAAPADSPANAAAPATPIPPRPVPSASSPPLRMPTIPAAVERELVSASTTIGLGRTLSTFPGIEPRERSSGRSSTS
jgi:hypothetical protein